MLNIFSGAGFQVRDNPPGDFKGMYRHISKGSWTFSMQDHGWQVSDCTGEGLKVKIFRPNDFFFSGFSLRFKFKLCYLILILRILYLVRAVCTFVCTNASWIIWRKSWNRAFLWRCQCYSVSSGNNNNNFFFFFLPIDAIFSLFHDHCL